MSQIEPEWAIVPEAEQMVAQLISTYPDKFGHISSADVGVAAITNKDRSDSADWFAKIEGVKLPEALYSSKKYIIWFHQNTWDEFDPISKQYLMLSQLVRIPDPPDGTLLKKDLQDSKALTKAFGVDYLFNVNKPDLISQKQIF